MILEKVMIVAIIIIIIIIIIMIDNNNNYYYYYYYYHNDNDNDNVDTVCALATSLKTDFIHSDFGLVVQPAPLHRQSSRFATFFSHILL